MERNHNRAYIFNPLFSNKPRASAAKKKKNPKAEPPLTYKGPGNSSNMHCVAEGIRGSQGVAEGPHCSEGHS